MSNIIESAFEVELEMNSPTSYVIDVLVAIQNEMITNFPDINKLSKIDFTSNFSLYSLNKLYLKGTVTSDSPYKHALTKQFLAMAMNRYKKKFHYKYSLKNSVPFFKNKS